MTLDAQAVRTRILRAVKDAKAGGDATSALILLLRRLDTLADDLEKGLMDAGDSEAGAEG